MYSVMNRFLYSLDKFNQIQNLEENTDGTWFFFYTVLWLPYNRTIVFNFCSPTDLVIFGNGHVSPRQKKLRDEQCVDSVLPNPLGVGVLLVRPGQPVQAPHVRWIGTVVIVRPIAPLSTAVSVPGAFSSLVVLVEDFAEFSPRLSGQERERESNQASGGVVRTADVRKEAADVIETDKRDRTCGRNFLVLKRSLPNI